MDEFINSFSYAADNLERVLETTLDHAVLVILAVALSTAVAIPLGVLVQRMPTMRAITLAFVGILFTLPSLALFALFVPLVGIGNPPAIMAMFLYALMPILRNTVTGLDAVSPAVVESAKGMGLNNFQQLLRVRLPLAWPVIMTGIRLSTLITVGIAAIAAIIGGDGLGSFVRAGLTRLGLPNSMEQIYVAVIFCVLLGLILDLILAAIQRFTTSPGVRH